MKDRFIGGFFVGLTTLIIFLAGGAVTALLLTAISLAAMYEFMNVYSLEKSPFAVLNYLGTVGIYVMLYLDQSQFLFPFIILLLLVTLSIYVICFPQYKDHHAAKSYFGFIYVTILLSYVFRLRALDSGMLLCIFILISSWGNDIFAYFVGSAIGKHKFSPKVSPNKSVEGFIGGVAGAGLLGYFFAVVFHQWISLSSLSCAIIAAVGAIPAVIGDLAASAVKRDNEIKDYSHLIPGHGGMVDRIDSVLFTAPITYYLVVLFNVV
ncbi:MAG: phosphatidate cytidylyltransferase [Clostridium sp.]|nr:phosphatidate cytidylyltransferase [Clostridium sp.]